jgi:hypothetical protein
LVQIASLAAWFVGIGYALDYQHPLEQSMDLAEQFMESQKMNSNIILQVLRTLQTSFVPERIENIEHQLLSDAKNAVLIANYHISILNYQLELNQLNNQQSTTNHQLTTTRFFTSYGKTHYEPLVSQCLIAIETQENKAAKKNIKNQAATNTSPSKEKSTTRAAQTFFRTGYANHIHLSSIADNKAHLMISVNSILISILLSGLTYRNLAQTTPAVMVPAAIFLFCGLVSLTFAILSVRPKVTSVILKLPEQDRKKALSFFGNFTALSFDAYETMLSEVLKDPNLIEANLTRDLYNLGKVLEKKYKLLNYSYDIFIVGFAVTVLTFLMAMLTSK